MVIDYLTGALVIITAFYAWATFRILRANEKVVEVMHEQAEAVTRPYVSVAPVLEPDNPIFYLRITNTGKTTANKLKLTIDKSFHKFGEKSSEADLASFAAFNNVIESFPPGAEIVFSLAQSFKLFGEESDKELLPQSFTITAEYSYGNKTVKENNIIDLKAYYGANIPQDAYVRKLKDISKAIEKVAENVSKKP
jgi:hypothetical protein